MACKYTYNGVEYSKEQLVSKLSNENSNFQTLYNNLINEITNTETGRKVLDRVKRDYQLKNTGYSNNIWKRQDLNKFQLDIFDNNQNKNKPKFFDTYEEAEKYYNNLKNIQYTLEEQQEEAIVELLGLMTAEKLDNVKDGKLISLLKRLLKEMKAFIRSLINQKEVEIDKLPDNMTINDLADLLAYSNSKLILPGYEVEYTTPDNMKFKTYQEASNHISNLVKNVEDVDLNNIKIKSQIDNIKDVPNEFTIILPFGNYVVRNDNGIWNRYELDTNKLITDNIPENVVIMDYNSGNNINSFLEKNKEYEQSKEIIEEWKKVNDIQYNPEEIYSRGQEFNSVVGAYSDFDVNLMMQNLLQHIEDNEKAGGKFAISAYTKPVDKSIGHLEGGGGKIKFKLYPQSKDILWAANTDVYSGSVWDASKKVNKDKKSELLGVSYTKYPSLRNVNSVQPNLASIVDDLAHHHNELGIVLTGNNFRLEYDDNIPNQTKKIIDSINSILDQKYGKLVKPENKKRSNLNPYKIGDYFNKNVEGYIPNENDNKVETQEEADYLNSQEYLNPSPSYNLYTVWNMNDDTRQDFKEFYSLKEAEEYKNKMESENKNIDFLLTTYDIKGIRPTQTKDNIKESISSIKNKLPDNIGEKYLDTLEVIEYNDNLDGIVIEGFAISNYGNSPILDELIIREPIFNTEEEANNRIKELIIQAEKIYEERKGNQKEYIEQALINTKIAKLKEVAKKYPRSLIRSEVKRSNTSNSQELFREELPFQKISSNSYQSVATEKTTNAIKELLTNLGISLEKVDTLVEEFGVNGIAEFSDMIIKIQSGMENVALTEEFMHFVSVMLPDNLLEDLMSNIESYEIYKLVYNQYKEHPAYQNEDGSPNVNKIKIETVGKLLAEYYIMKAEGLTPEEVNIAKTLWNRIKDWLKGLFTNQTNAFADLIDKLNSGELLLDDTSISRYDKLLQLTETNASKIVSFLQKDFQKEDLTKYDTNIERINNFLDLIKNFKEQDLPFILSKSKGVGVVKDTFAQSRYFLKDIEDKDTLKDALTNAVNYMRSSYNASVTLGNRVAVIKKELKEIETKEYEKTEEKHKEIRFKNLELSNIQKILETYKDEFNDLYNMFSEEDSGELIDFLKEAIGQVDSTLVVVGNQLKVQAFEQLRKEFSKKERNIRIRLEEEIHSQKQQLEQAATESMKQRHRDKIEALERELSNPSLTFNKLIKLLEQGEEKNNWFFRLIEGPLTSSNEVIQLITNQLEDVISDITKEHQGQLIELKNIFQGRIQNIQDTAYDKYIHEAKKYKFSIETGDLIETHHLELVSNVDQTAFENDIEILKYLKTVPFFKALERYEEEIGGKFTNIRFTEKNQEEFLSDLIKNIYANHAEEKYTEEYRKIYDILNTTISTGESVKELRSKVNDQLRKAKSLLDSVVGTNDFELYMEDIRELDAQLLEMELFYDKDGNKKTGDSLLIAKTIDKWKQAKQKASEEGKPLYKNFITHTAQITWEEQKRKIDEKYEADPVKHEKERNDWYALNVTVKEDPKFIEERNNIYKAINIVLSKYDSSEFNEANKAIDDIRKLLRAVLRKYTVEGTVNGNNATTEEQLFVKNKEKELNYLKDEIRKNKENLTAKDYETLQVLFSDLEKIQTEGVTEHWLQALSLLGTNLSQDDLLQNQFVRNNTINVTDKYMGKALPQGYLVSSDNEIFAPTMLWRNTIPTDPEYKREQVPSFKWHSSRVNEIYENEKTITDNRKVKATSSIYANAKYGQLTSDEILFVENVRKKYYADQMRKPVTMRLGDVLPFMQKSGIQKTAKGIKNIFSPDTYKAITAERFLGKDFRENVLGEGKEDKSRKVDINSYSYKFKYASDSDDMLSQERDLYKLLKAYNYEAIKYDRMKMLLPELNSVRKVIVNSLQKNKNNTNLLKDVDIFVEKAINKKTTRENTPLASFVRKFTSKMRSLTANVFLRLPWLYTGSIKSLVANAYFTFTNHSFLKQFSEGSLLKGYKSAAGRLIDYSYNEYKLVPSKYTAIMKRLRLIEDDTLNKDLDANTNILLKIANNMGYAASLGHRQAFERYAMFAMSEMYFQTLSKEIEDFYEYDEKTGTVTLKEGENLDENKITSDVRDMAQFTLGNYNPANDPILKHTALGQILMFFGNHIPNGIISRVGPGTTLRSGVEVKPYMAFWKADVRKIYLDLFKGLMSMDALTILKHKHLTATEKNVLFRFYKDFLLTNLLGASYYIISKAMQESGDDDDDELSWYALMVFRKAYSEMSYFNPVEKAGIPLRLLTDEKFGYKGNSIQKTFDYVIGKKAVEMLTPSIFPGDYRGLRFDTEDIKTKDPYYAQYKNNLLLYNFHRYTRTKAFFDYKYGKQAIKGFEYFDKSIYQYEKDKK